MVSWLLPNRFWLSILNYNLHKLHTKPCWYQSFTLVLKLIAGPGPKFCVYKTCSYLGKDKDIITPTADTTTIDSGENRWKRVKVV